MVLEREAERGEASVHDDGERKAKSEFTVLVWLGRCVKKRPLFKERQG